MNFFRTVWRLSYLKLELSNHVILLVAIKEGFFLSCCKLFVIKFYFYKDLSCMSSWCVSAVYGSSMLSRRRDCSFLSLDKSIIFYSFVGTHYLCVPYRTSYARCARVWVPLKNKAHKLSVTSLARLLPTKKLTRFTS